MLEPFPSSLFLFSELLGVKVAEVSIDANLAVAKQSLFVLIIDGFIINLGMILFLPLSHSHTQPCSEMNIMCSFN